MATPTEDQDPWYLRSSVPVLFPMHDGLDLSLPQTAFDVLVRDIIRSRETTNEESAKESQGPDGDESDSITLVSTPTTTQEIRGPLEQIDLSTTLQAQTPEPDEAQQNNPYDSAHPFIQGLLLHDCPVSVFEEDLENRMLTENGDIAYRSTTSPLVDLFAELEDVVSGPRLLELLNVAWKQDSLATLKIVFNARSIHLGKASRLTFYRCAGWLAQYHPLTLVANLRWLSRPVIQKKVEKKEEGNQEEEDKDMVIVDNSLEKDAEDMTRFDVKHGVSHGYWKDLLNILILSVEGSLNVLAQPRDILNVEQPPKSNVSVNKEEAKTRRHETRNQRHKNAVEKFHSDPVYRGLYLSVARLFAEQLKIDLALLKGEDHKARKDISLCAKWAPSHDRFHDKHTFIVSSIAEMLHPPAEFGLTHQSTDRELYLRHAREEYRKDVSALRSHLDIVERNLSAKTYDKIKYERVPSIAMNNYSDIFAERDSERFAKYLDDVVEGKAHISGATLLPSTLIKQVRDNEWSWNTMKARVTDLQWKTLVQRIKDSGTLESSIAVCDASLSMEYPVFPDGTRPMDSAIGLSLLVAEVTAPPFGGHFITFSETPQVQSIDPFQLLNEKYLNLRNSTFGMSTNLTAVFQSLILPMAVRNRLSQDEMVKRVFVFSDMQFNSAESGATPGDSFSSSYERIKASFAAAGYEMPELIFWNLAGGRAGYGEATNGDPIAPKPVTSEKEGTTVVSGYSQGMLKVFLDNGSFDDPELESEEREIETTEEGDLTVVNQELAKKRKIDPMSTVKKAIGHKSYDPLAVVD